MYRPTLFLALALLLCAAPARAASSTTVVSAGVLNEFAASLGGLSGNLGHYELKQPYPCFPDWWNTCWNTLASGDVTWRMPLPRFSIDDSGISVSGEVTASIGGFGFSQQVTARVTIDTASPELLLRIQQLNIPLTFNIPGYGNWTPVSLPLPLSQTYRIGIPVGFIPLPVASVAGTTKHVRASVSRLTFDPAPGYLLITAEHNLW